MDATLKKQLEITATKVRMGVIEGVYNAKSGHPGGSLSVADVLTYLYFAKMNVDPKILRCPNVTDLYCQRDTQPLHCTRYLLTVDFPCGRLKDTPPHRLKAPGTPCYEQGSRR